MCDKFHAALDEVQEAVNEINDRDRGSDALKALRLAVTQLGRSDASALDGKASEELAEAIATLLAKCAEKIVRRGHVFEVVKTLLPRPAWAVVFRHQPAVLQSLTATLDVIAGDRKIAAEVPKLKEFLERSEEEVQREKAGVRRVLKEVDATGDTEADEINECLMSGFKCMEACKFTYKPSCQTCDMEDKAMEGFRSFKTGVGKLSCKFLNGKRTVSLEYVKILSQFKDHWSDVMNLLVALYTHRLPFRNQVLFVDEKLAIVCEDYKATRAGKFHAFPWAPLAPAPVRTIVPGPPTWTICADSDVDDMSKKSVTTADVDHWTDVNPVTTSENVEPVHGSIPAGVKCTVVWIDCNEDCSEKATKLKAAGINVVAYHDRSRTDPKCDAVQRAKDYLIHSTSDQQEIVVAIIGNAAPGHRQLMKNIWEFCVRREQYPPYLAACTMKGTMQEFEDDGVRIGAINKDRTKVMEAVVTDYMRRKLLLL